MIDRAPLVVETTITACVIARDEAQNLAELLPELRWAGEVLVVIDSTTRDDSADVAAFFADRVETRDFSSFSSFRNAAMALARSRWVFFVDADERVSDELAAEIQAAVAQVDTDRLADTRDEAVVPPATVESGAPVAFWVPRLNIIFGRLIRGGGWSPDYQLRLLRRDRCRYDERKLVHEIVELEGRAGHLEHRLLHFNYRSIREFVEKQRRYTAMEAAELRATGGRPRARSLVGAPAREFARRYFALAGWADGPIGLFLSATLAYFAYKRVRIARTLTVDA